MPQSSLPDNLVDLWESSATRHGPRELFGTRQPDGSFTWTTYVEVDVRINCAEDRSVSILPWAHVYGQTAELYNFIQIGGSIAISGGPETLAEDLGVVRPTYLITVPRMFNKIYDGIHEKLRQEGGLKLRLFKAAMTVARRHRVEGKCPVG